MNKKQAIAIAKEFGWTIADAERAYQAANITFGEDTPSSQEAILALVNFAGPELKRRQGLQAAQKGLVTKRNNYIQELESNYSQTIEEIKKEAYRETSALVSAIGLLYKFAKPLGLKDPWIETMLVTYNKYRSDDSLPQPIDEPINETDKAEKVDEAKKSDEKTQINGEDNQKEDGQKDQAA